ncbi:MAG TPA: hypothetical protein DCF87_09415 [Opitutae bacterium]|nr:hypothetical protein [Opitutae bacterium]|tara:strand:+ start:53 stop:514 length:462 start_codon:yes stop_codon:yes gene_type:complete
MKSFRRFITESTGRLNARHYFAESSIQGTGSFASTDIVENDIVFMFLKNTDVNEYKSFDRTDFCRLTNHSSTPNMNLQFVGEDVYAVSNREIFEDEELTIDYEEAYSMIAIKNDAAINEKIIRMTPGFENIEIQNDSHKDLLDEIQDIRNNYQ